MRVYLLLDRSGSMSSMWNEALNSIDGYVKKLGNRTKVYMSCFDDVSYDVLRECNASKWSKVTDKEVRPRGMTPLYDSAGKVLDRMFEDNPKKAVFVVMTDGYENASKEYSQRDIKAKLKLAEEKDWPTIFLGADFAKVSDVASGLGIATSNTMNVTPRNLVSTMACLSAKTETYFTTGVGTTASAESMLFTDDDRKTATRENK